MPLDMKKKNVFLWVLILLSCNHQRGSYIEEQITGYCSCENASFNLVRCDTTHYTTGAKTYWQWTCDSAWLTFETKKKGKKTIQSFHGEYIPKSQNIGPRFIKELSNKLWFKQQKISGCCYPPSHFILDSKNGNILFNLPEKLFVHENTEKNLLFYFKDTTYQVLTLYNIQKNIKTHYTFPDNRISQTVTHGGVPYVKDLFNEPLYINREIILPYRYFQSNKKDTSIWVKSKCHIDY